MIRPPHASTFASPVNARRWCLLAVAVGAAVRVYLMLTASVIARDGTQYVTMARRMVFDWPKELSNDYPLGFPFLIRLAHALGGYGLSSNPVIAWQRSGQLVALLFGVGCIPLIYLLARQMLGVRCGLLAAWIWALLPNAAALSADALSDMPNLALTLAGLLLLMRAVRVREIKFFFLASLLSGAAYTIRPEGAEVALVCLAAGFVGWRVAPGRRIAAASAVIVGFAVIGGSYILLEGGRILNKQTWLTEDQAVLPATITAWATAHQAGVLSPPGRLIEKLSTSLNHVWLTVGLLFWLLPGARRRAFHGLSPPTMLFVLHTAVLLWFYQRAGYISHRHTMLLAVAAVIMSAGTLAWFARWLKKRVRPNQKWAAGCADAVLVALISASLLPWLLRDINSSRWYIRHAADYIMEHSRPRLRRGDQAAGHPLNIISQDGWVPFYAGLVNWGTCHRAADLANAGDLSIVNLVAFDLHEIPPARIHQGPGNREFRLTETARFTDPHGKRGIVIYAVGEAGRQ